ncbi:unnamed protein product [Ectocarpus sp. 8 AP-2014]
MRSTQVSEDPNSILLEEARAGRVDGLKACLEDFASRTDVNGGAAPAAPG